MAVRTYSRSEKADERDPSDDPDWVDENSDFEELMTADMALSTRCFFHNDLSKMRGYKNSHYTPEQMKNGEMAYTSTIVWPIRKKLKDEPEKLLGFLCADSKVKDVFEKRYDVEIGASYADTLYMLLHPIWNKDSAKPPEKIV